MEGRFTMVLLNNQATWIKELPYVSELKEYILNEFKKSHVFVYLEYGLVPDSYIIKEWSCISIETEIEYQNNIYIPFKNTKTATFYRCSVCGSSLKRIDDEFTSFKGHNSSCRKNKNSKSNKSETLSLNISNFSESRTIKKLSLDSLLNEFSVESKIEVKEVDLTCAK